MDDHQILARAMTWMRQRGWREKLAKSSSGQSLYEHTLIELDAFLQLAPILRDPKRYGLTDLENWTVIVALIVHDAGKEGAEWQEYVTSRGAAQWVSHIVPELSEELVPEICASVGIEGIDTAVHQVIAGCAGIHHDRPGRSDAAILKAMLIRSRATKPATSPHTSWQSASRSRTDTTRSLRWKAAFAGGRRLRCQRPN